LVRKFSPKKEKYSYLHTILKLKDVINELTFVIGEKNKRNKRN